MDPLPGDSPESPPKRVRKPWKKAKAKPARKPSSSPSPKAQRLLRAVGPAPAAPAPVPTPAPEASSSGSSPPPAPVQAPAPEEREQEPDPTEKESDEARKYRLHELAKRIGKATPTLAKVLETVVAIPAGFWMKNGGPDLRAYGGEIEFFQEDGRTKKSLVTAQQAIAISLAQVVALLVPVNGFDHPAFLVGFNIFACAGMVRGIAQLHEIHLKTGTNPAATTATPVQEYPPLAVVPTESDVRPT